MISVNLLPHRQQQRELLQKKFLYSLSVASIVSVVIVFMGWTYLTTQIDEQSSRNQRISDATILLDRQISDIKDLKEQISAVLSRKQVVENLQGDRSQAVVILDELSRKLPDGVFYTGIKQVGNLITVEGVADTNSRVATLITSLEVSKVMELPNLIEIKAIEANGQKKNMFSFNVKLRKISSEEDDKKPSASKNSKQEGEVKS